LPPVKEDRKEAGDGPVPDATTDEVEAVLRKLTPSKTRLLKPVKVKGADAFELFHDVLAQPVLQWRREFITNARLEQERRRLAAERDEKERRQREETARIAKRRRRNGAVALLLVASLAFGFFLLWEKASWDLDAAQSRVQELEQARKQHFEGLNAASRKEYASAISLFTQSLSIYQKYGQSSRMVHAKVDRGNVYALSGNIASAEKDVDQAIDTARRTQSAGDEGLATESKASLHERLKEPDAVALYEQAGDSYQTAGDSLSVARLLEWKGTRAETDRQLDTAANHYKRALERYRIAGEGIGVARIEEAIHRVVPWGFFVDLRRGEAFPMRGKSISVGRNTDNGPQNDVSFSNEFVSRHHLLINREGFQAVDLRSTNGTYIGAIPLPFEGSQALVDGDLVALASEVLQFTTREHPPPTPPPAAWAIFINGSTRTYTYLTEKTYSLVLTSRDLRVEPGENAAAILSLHGGQDPQLQYANGEWSLVFEYKEDYREYGDSLVPAAKWVLIHDLPARFGRFVFVKLSADRRQIVEEGPAFQIVTIAHD
jgi:tetratricopeptide (TPR) repeat protein